MVGPVLYSHLLDSDSPTPQTIDPHRRSMVWGLGGLWRARKRQPIGLTGDWGQSLSGVQGQSPWSGAQLGGQNPLKLKPFSFSVPKQDETLPPFRDFIQTFSTFRKISLTPRLMGGA